MRQRHLLAATALAVTVLSLPQRSSASTLELALVIDGSGSISASDWQLQIGAYQSIFQNNFYTNFVVPSPYDDIAVAAYVFSGTIAQIGPDVIDFAVFSFIDWTLINDDADAFGFGAQFAGLPQPAAQTYTNLALNIAANGGFVGCPRPTGLPNPICSPEVPLTPPFRATATGLLNNAYDGDALVIDISTDGVPTLPNAGGDPNNEPEVSMDRALAIAAADAARAAGITVNAIGVGPGVDAAFLTSLVGIDPASTPTGFFIDLTGSGFGEFNDALVEKIGRETAVPVTPALPLALTAFGSALFWRCKRATAG